VPGLIGRCGGGGGVTAPLATIRVERILTGLAVPPYADYPVDFTGATVSTNDGGHALSANSTTLSPFSGSYFSFDWASDPHSLFIDTDGLYLVYRFWWMIDYDLGALVSPALIGMLFSTPMPNSANSGKGWLMVNGGDKGNLTVRSLINPDPDVPTVLEQTELIAVSGSARLKVSVTHSGAEGNMTEASFGMAAVYLGTYRA
jgi:hypothetical protein